MRALVVRSVSASEEAEWARALGPYADNTMLSAAYHRVCEWIWGGRAALWIAEKGENRLAWPVIEHGVPGVPGCVDFNSACGFNGPLETGGSEFAAEAADVLIKEWRRRGVVSVFTRFSPFLANHLPIARWVAGRSDIGTVSMIGHVVAIDTSGGPDAIRRDISKGELRQIRKAERLGLRTEEDREWRRVDGFLKAYESVGARNNFAERHMLQASDLEFLRDRLRGSAHLFHTLDGERVAASVVAVKSGGVLHALFGGPDAEYMRLGAFMLLLVGIADWCWRNGIPRLDLGGGRNAYDADPLYAFKSRFSKLRLEFHIARLIVNREKYDELSASTLMRNRLEDKMIPKDFFPMYRAVGHALPAAMNESDE